GDLAPHRHRPCSAPPGAHRHQHHRTAGPAAGAAGRDRRTPYRTHAGAHRSHTMTPDLNAPLRQRLLAVTAALLESLYDAGAVAVLATLRPTDMRPGGARVPGTSYELEAGNAARAMRELLALRGVQADPLLQALAQADQVARYAVLAG